MSRKIVVARPGIDEAEKQMILDTAAGAGYDVSFFEGTNPTDEMMEAEILYGVRTDRLAQVLAETDLLIRAVFVVKQHFYDHVSWTELLRKKNEDKLQRMCSVGVGALCLLELSEAVITSWGNWVVFFSHLNISASIKSKKKSYGAVRKGRFSIELGFNRPGTRYLEQL